MGKQPYIPLYIGDWEQDVNTLSLLAEGAWLKLTFKLWKANPKGLLSISFRAMSNLFKLSEADTRSIFDELIESKVFDHEILPGEIVKITSRRMARAGQISEVKSAAGKLGGRPKKQASKSKAKLKQTESKQKAKVKQNTDIENEYENENDIEDNKKEKVSDFLSLIKSDPRNKDLNFPFSSEKFIQIWGQLNEKKKWKKKLPSTLQLALDKLSKFKEEFVIEIMENAIIGDWQGLIFPDTEEKYQRWLKHKPKTVEKNADYSKDFRGN